MSQLRGINKCNLLTINEKSLNSVNSDYNSIIFLNNDYKLINSLYMYKIFDYYNEQTGFEFNTLDDAQGYLDQCPQGYYIVTWNGETFVNNPDVEEPDYPYDEDGY